VTDSGIAFARCLAAALLATAVTVPARSQRSATRAEAVPSNVGAAISGHVSDATSTPIRNYSVVVFSTDRAKWIAPSRFLRLARPTQDGSFEVTGLPPGEYMVAAVDPIDGDDASGDWQKPETLERLSFRAVRVMLAERQRYMTVLRLIRR
jgi:transcriptional regulator GlxA family with amidase domain